MPYSPCSMHASQNYLFRLPHSEFRIHLSPSSDLCLMSSVNYFLSSVICQYLRLAVFCHLSSAICFLISVFCYLSSVNCLCFPPSAFRLPHSKFSVFHHLSSIFRHLSSVTCPKLSFPPSCFRLRPSSHFHFPNSAFQSLPHSKFRIPNSPISVLCTSQTSSQVPVPG